MKIRTIFDRAVTCARVLPHLSNAGVRRNLATLHRSGTMASSKEAGNYFSMLMINAANRSAAKSSYQLAQYFKSVGVEDLSVSYFSDWSYWMNKVKEMNRRIYVYELSGHQPGEAPSSGGNQGCYEHDQAAVPSNQGGVRQSQKEVGE